MVKRPTELITRRHMLRLLAGSGGAFLLNGCGGGDVQDLPPTVTPMRFLPATATTVPTRTKIVATPTQTIRPTFTPVVLTDPTPTLRPTITPIPTATTTPIPTFTPMPVPTMTPIVEQGESIFMPLIEQADAGVVNGEAYPVSAAPPTVTPTPTPRPCLTPLAPPVEKVPPFVGLHASADPQIVDWERCLFLETRPSVIKVLTFHPPEDIGRLAQSQPYARWLVRTFLEFGGRNVSADQFVEWTLSDTYRTLNVLNSLDVFIELHNEPNLVAEGWQTTWADGTAFTNWFLDVLAQYRTAMPGARFLYPGLSPGGDIDGVRRDSALFWEESRAAVEAADGLGLHLYWSADYPMAAALATLDEVIGRFPNKLIWITEASYNSGDIDDAERARQYLEFINQLRLRPVVQGVTFFVASALDPQFADEVWLGRSVGRLIGERGR